MKILVDEALKDARKKEKFLICKDCGEINSESAINEDEDDTIPVTNDEDIEVKIRHDYQKINVLAIIPARGGSKRIPHKNIQELNGKPLIAYTIEAAKKSRMIDSIVVSTDDFNIAEVAERYGAEVVMRPKELAEDDSSTEDAMIHAVNTVENEGFKVDYVVLLQPTSPLRTAEIIDKGIAIAMTQKTDTLMSVCEAKHYYLSGHFEGEDYVKEYCERPFTHTMQKKYVENGALYVTKKDFLMRERNRIGGKMKVVVMNPAESIDIDEPSDLKLAEELLKHGR